MNAQPVYQYLPTLEIEKDISNLREGVNREHVESIKNTIRMGIPTPPIKVRYEHGIYRCFDGFHRLTAYKELGITSILVEIWQCNPTTARVASYLANLGRPWTEAEKGKFALDDYKRGVPVSEIIKNYHFKTGDEMEGYIRRAYWLESSIHERMGALSKVIGNELLKYYPNDQLIIFRSTENLTGQYVINFGTARGFQKQRRCLKDIPRSAAAPTDYRLQVVLQPETINPQVAELQMLRTNIQAYCQKYGCGKESLLAVL